MILRKPFDFATLAENGLRRGVTTGTCATGAVQAAFAFLLGDSPMQRVQVNLPDGQHYVSLPVKKIAFLNEQEVQAAIQKEAGDDPDVTNGATITAIVRRNQQGRIQFYAGKGVGTITLPGFSFPVGDPAINPVPRQMMQDAIATELAQRGLPATGFDLILGCEEGEALAKKTYNPRLGIVGGISILGAPRGLWKPKSLSSWLASIELYLQIALADAPQQIALVPGNLGQSFALETLHLPKEKIVQMANFVGFTLTALDQTLTKISHTLPTLWVAGHPGKLAKNSE